MTGFFKGLRLSSRSACIFLAALTVILFAFAPANAQSRVTLSQVATTRLDKQNGRVDQAVSLPGGGFVIRNSDFRNEGTQSIEIYDQQGHFRGKVGTFGRSPGQYYRLKSIAVAADGQIWAADVIGRVTQFGQDGRVLSTKLIQKPKYHVYGLALDEARGALYLSGCSPKKVYLDLGCHLVHKYSLGEVAYQRSFLDTDPEAVDKHLLALEDYHLDIDFSGRIWVVDAPILKLFRIDPATSLTQSFPLKSRLAIPVGAIVPSDSTEVHQSIADNSFLVDRVVTTGSYIVVSIRRPKTTGYILQVFSSNGQQIGVDVNAPGRLVGKTKSGRLYFTSTTSQGFEISEYGVSVPVQRR